MRRIVAGILVLMSLSVLITVLRIQQVKASGTIYILPDGSVDPPTTAIQREGDTYFFVDDLQDSAIIVLRNNIIINGNGHTLEGFSGVTYGGGLGIYLKQVNGVTIRNLKIKNCYMCGIYIVAGSFNIIYGNEITSNEHGIDLHGGSSENRIYENDITNNRQSILLGWASGNIIFHNNIVDGVVSSNNYSNVLDDGYPSGGNYWYDYEGEDVKNGINQDQPGSDGFGDTPYVLDPENIDRYPLMCPFGSLPLTNHTLTITAPSEGTTDPTPGNYTYSEGQNVSVTAIPSLGYGLDRWVLDGVDVGSANPFNVTMNTDHVLTPIFAPTHTLAIAVTSEGTTEPAPGVYTYLVGTVVTVAALPDEDCYLDYWLLDDVSSSINPINVTMNSNHVLDAVFARIMYDLDITVSTGGSTNPPAGTHTYPSGTPVSVSASPDNGYYLDAWLLDNVNIGIADPFNLTMDMNHTLHATFKQLSPGHDVAVKGVASKTVVGQGNPLTIKVTIINIGIFTETFNVTAYANATVIQTLTNVTLTSGNFTTVIFTWNTSDSAKGNYTLRAYAWPVPDEINTTDNTCTGFTVYVGIPGDIDGNHIVEIKDILAIALAYGLQPGDREYNPNTDINCDDFIDIKDILTAAINYGQHHP